MPDEGPGWTPTAPETSPDGPHEPPSAPLPLDPPVDSPAQVLEELPVRPERRERAPAPPPLTTGRALAGAAVALVGVLLAVSGVLLLTGGDDGPGSTAPRPSSPTTASTSVQDPPVPPSGLATEPSAPEPSAPDPSAPDPSAPDPSAPDPSAPGPGAPGPGIASGEPAPGNPPLTVLDGSSTAGLGDQAVARLRVSGWDVQDLGPLPGGAAETTVYYDVGQQDAAQRLADQFDLPVVLPRPEGLPGVGLTLVVVDGLG